MVMLLRIEEIVVYFLWVLWGLLCYIDYIVLLYDNVVSWFMKNELCCWKKKFCNSYNIIIFLINEILLSEKVIL